MKAPVAKKIPYTHTYHNQQFEDPYHWMREKENPDVMDYLTKENEYTQHKMKPTESLQEELFEEIKARIKEDDESVPVWNDGYFYYSRHEEGKQYAIHCRKKGSLQAEEEILLDENELAKDRDYFSLGEFSISPNNQFLAYSFDIDGSENYSIFVKDLFHQKVTNTGIVDSYSGLEWSNDNTYLFYTKLDETHRPFQLWRHHFGTNIIEDVLVFQEDDDSFFLDISKSKDESFLFITLSSQITNEVWFLNANEVLSEFQVVSVREKGIEYEVDVRLDQFHILTNADGALNFKWMKTNVKTPSRKNWVNVMPYNENHYLLSLEVFQDYYVLEERVDGMLQVRVVDASTLEQHQIQFEEHAYSVFVGDNPEYQSKELRIHYRSMVTPNSTFDYHMDSKVLTLKKRQEIPSGYDASRYHTERLFVTATDGAEIPVSIVYRKDKKSEQGNYLYLYGYGSYGINVDPYFSVARLSLLDRGFVFAIAHVRGSSTKGRQWYQDGKFLQKKNTFTDFISVANYFVEQNWTSPDKIIANGGSAGGLLMGAIANMAPELFQVIVADVPFVDVINTMMDDKIPLTVIEYDEWGNPNDKRYFDYMLSYSPYDNVEQKKYPAMLVTAGLNDPRVQYWEPAKWVAKLRELKSDSQDLLFKINLDAGHSGVSGRFEQIKETAFEYAFIFDQFGL